MIRNQLYSCPSCQFSCIAKSNDTVLLTCRNCGEIVHNTTSVNYPSVAVPADWSFIQIGTKGNFVNKPFEVIGRIRFQLRNDYKNCWTICYADQSLGWLVESMGSFIMADKTSYKLSADHTPKLKATKVIKIGTNLTVTGEYIEKCEQMSYEGEIGPWKDLAAGFFFFQASSKEGKSLLFTVRPNQDSIYIMGQKTDLANLKLENIIQWNEWN